MLLKGLSRTGWLSPPRRGGDLRGGFAGSAGRGDFYDAFAVDDGQVALVGEDVSGKGLSAAIYEGMRDLAVKAQSLKSLQETGEAILSGAQDFAGGALSDDACLLLAQRLARREG